MAILNHSLAFSACATLVRPWGAHAARKWVSAARRNLRAARWIPRFLAILFCTSLLAAEEPSEDQVKAAFLVNFPKYVEWPAETWPATNSPIVLGVIGDTKVAAEIEKMIVGKSVNGRRLLCRQLEAGEQGIHDCQVLFIGVNERKAVEILTRLRTHCILVVGENPGFLDQGGTINLAKRDRKIRLEIDLAAARKARLRISSKLLSIAETVRGKES